jgi:hypothetical protein
MYVGECARKNRGAAGGTKRRGYERILKICTLVVKAIQVGSLQPWQFSGETYEVIPMIIGKNEDDISGFYTLDLVQCKASNILFRVLRKYREREREKYKQRKNWFNHKLREVFMEDNKKDLQKAVSEGRIARKNKCVDEILRSKTLSTSSLFSFFYHIPDAINASQNLLPTLLIPFP